MSPTCSYYVNSTRSQRSLCHEHAVTMATQPGHKHAVTMATQPGHNDHYVMNMQLRCQLNQVTMITMSQTCSYYGNSTRSQ